MQDDGNINIDRLSIQLKLNQNETSQASDTLCHLLPIKIKKRLIEDASLHPLADLDHIIGPVYGPAIQPEILKQNPRVCILCGVDFKSLAGLHAHLTYHKHILGELDPVLNIPIYDCRSCRNIINCTTLMKHRCYIKQMADIKARRKFIDKNGSPLVCILCRGRIFPSRVHLIIHIIVAHSVNRDPYKCVFCQAQFISENLMMQEVHAFDCHAPVLFILTRKGIYKLLRNVKNNIIDPALPFSCFYDSVKLERRQLTNLKGRNNYLSSGTDTPSNLLDQGQSSSSATTSTTKHKLCLTNFNCLAEFTTHICCYHGASTLDNGQDNTNTEDPIEEVRRAQKRSLRVPGPTVSELLRKQNTNYQASNKPHDDDFQSSPSPTAGESSSPTPPSGMQRSRSRSIKKVPSSISISKRIRMSRVKSSSFRETGQRRVKFRTDGHREQCRMCLELFSDDYKLNNHVNMFHLPESKKRLKHLAEKNKLSGMLDVSLLCTECYITYRDEFSLQIHMLVSHTGKDWRHCGLCNYEFFSESGGTPNHLRFVSFSTDNSEGPSKSIPAHALSGGSSTDAWPLPPELMWRIIIAHETFHKKRLFPARNVPYLPVHLVDTLIDSNAVQADLVAYWLVHRAKEATEGIKPKDDDDETGAEDAEQEGFIQTRDAFGINKPRANIIPLDKDTVQEARAKLGQLVSIRRMTQDESALRSIGRSSTYRASSHNDLKLPDWMAREFGELGERNASKQNELDFEENL